MQQRLPANWYLTRLQNDLRILVIEDHRVPLVTVELGIRGGRITQNEANEGVPTLLQELLLRSASGLQGELTAEAYTQRHHLATASVVGAEHLGFRAQCNRTAFRQAVDLLAQAALAPQWDTLELIRTKIEIAKARQAQQQLPVYFLQEAVEESIGKYMNLAKRPEASYLGIRSVALSHLEEYRKQYFLPNYSFLVIVGSVDHDSCFAIVDSAFGAWAKPTAIRPADIRFPALLADTALAMLHESVQVPHLTLALQLPDVLSSQRHYVLGKLVATLLGMRNGPLWQGTVAAGHTAALSTQFEGSQYTSSLTLSALPYADRIPQTLTRVYRVLDSLQVAGFITEAELTTAIRLLKAEFYTEQETGWGYAAQVAQLWATTGLSNLPEYLKQLSSVTTEDVRRFCEQYVSNTPVVQGLLMNQYAFSQDGVEERATRVLRPAREAPVQAPVPDTVVSVLLQRIIPYETMQQDLDSLAEADTTQQVQLAVAPPDTLPRPTLPPSLRLPTATQQANLLVAEVPLVVADTVRATANIPPTIEPEPPPVPTQTDTVLVRQLVLYFNNNSSEVDTLQGKQLQALAQRLEANPTWRVLIEGHSDSPGPADYNQRLSLERAHLVKRYIVNVYNISPLQLEVKGFGESRPAYPETPVTLRARNRRVSLSWLAPATE
jgi:predicted Zn-dependent peptidase/outer membrane protein OmpA-like peptidoglycan-associated protein